MIQNTGKGGAYRYYCCSRRLKEGSIACRGMRIRMDRLDGIVLDEVTKRMLEPERLESMLQAYVRTALERENRNRDLIRDLRQDHGEAEAGITRLLELVEKGLMDAEGPSLRERLVSLRFRRNELARYDGPPDLRQTYARLLLREVTVDDREICICGSKAILARTAAEGLGTTTPAVLSLFGNGAPGRMKMRTGAPASTTS